MAPPESALPSTKICQIVLLLRFIQQPSLAITGFVASYLIYWHYALVDPIPVPFTILLISCVFNYLQSYLFIIYPLLQNYSLLLKTSVPGAILLTIGFGTLWAIPGIRGEEDDYFEPFRQTQGWKLADAGVEEHHRTLVRILVTVGATAVLCSLAMVGIAGWGVWRERRRKGYAVLGLEEGLDGADMDMDDEEDDEIAMKTL